MDRMRADRCLEVARALRAAAEETRRTLQTSRDLVRRSSEQSLSAADPAPCRDDDLPPSKDLVESVIDAYETAQDEADAQTCLLLGHVLQHLGRRILNTVGPNGMGIAVH